jgi:hypothetical protein
MPDTPSSTSARLKFWAGVFQDDTASGGANAGQFFSFLALIACIAWGTFYVWKHQQIPDGGTLTAMGGFSTIHYLVHRGGSAYKPTGQQPNGPQ